MKILPSVVMPFAVSCGILSVFGGVLGGFLGPALGPRLGLEGAMDELRLYPRELTSAEIMADYVRHIPFMNSRICRPPRTRARRRIAARSACGTRNPRWTRSSSSTTRSTTGTPTSSSGV